MAPVKPSKKSSKAGPSSSSSKQDASSSSTIIPANPAKLAKNPRLPATMITPSGNIQPSQKTSKKGKAPSKKQKARAEKGKERAVERSGVLAEKVREREERKAKRHRAKLAWE